MSPFCGGCIRIIMGFIPPGGWRGALVAGTLPANIGHGSSKMAAGWPSATSFTKRSISAAPSDDGCTANRTSNFSVIGLAGSTFTTSYCFSNSSMIGHSGIDDMFCMLKPP